MQVGLLNAATTQQVLEDIAGYIRKCDPNPARWYAGITSSIDDRLFGAHCVVRETGIWIYRDASSASAARVAERALLDWGCSGGGGGGDDRCRYVYAYLKATGTKP